MCATIAALRSQRGAGEHDVVTGKLLGLSWILAVTGGGGYAVATVLEFRRLATR